MIHLQLSLTTNKKQLSANSLRIRETVEMSCGAHYMIRRVKDKWRLRETKKTVETAETSGGAYQGIRRARDK